MKITNITQDNYTDENFQIYIEEVYNFIENHGPLTVIKLVANYLEWACLGINPILLEMEQKNYITIKRKNIEIISDKDELSITLTNKWHIFLENHE